ncbi:MAG: O-antigen ligase family protein [Candidatus Competibacteraceae bacterium]|nr:O-antigen ligase family protein [Candidatus Competibacteraceae bacterium]
MTFAALHQRVESAFFQHGWLLPALLPLAELGGRGLYNTLVSLYGVWGLLGLWSRRQRLDPAVTLFYLLVLGVFLAGIPGAMSAGESMRLWPGFLASSLSLLLVQAALWESPDALDRLLRAVALVGVSVLIGLYGLAMYYRLEFSGRSFDPVLQLQEDNLPFLLPFLLAWIWWRDGDVRRRYGGMAAAVAIVLAYVALSEGRAALLGLLVGLIVFGKLVLGWRWRWIAALAAAVLAAAIVLNPEPFRKMNLDPARPLDAFTAGRTALWRQALAHPPQRPWLGVGLGNGHRAAEILSFELNGQKIQVHHLHNFLLEAWYETGILGVGALLGLISAVFGRLARRWERLSLQDRQRAGVLLAAASGIMGSALLSFSYTSRHFAYLFLCLGALSYLTGKTGGANAEKVGVAL